MQTPGNLTLGALGRVRPAPDPALTADDILKAAEDLVPLLRERAVAADRDRRIEPDTYGRLGDAGFFHILKPEKYGGLELSEHVHAKVAMTLARGCASTAWVFSILSSDNMAVLAFPEQVQDEVSGDRYICDPGGQHEPQPQGQGGESARWLPADGPVGVLQRLGLFRVADLQRARRRDRGGSHVPRAARGCQADR